MRSNKRIVAILRGIPASHQKRLFLDCLTVDQELIRLGLVAQIFLHRILYISKRPAAFLPCKLLADRRIKTDSAGTEKDTSVRLATINCRNVPLYNQIDRPAYIHRNMQLTRQTIAGTFRDNPQHSIRMEHGAGNLVHSPVSPDRNHAIGSFIEGLPCQFTGMSGIFRKRNFHTTISARKGGFNHFRNLPFRTDTRNRIYNSLYIDCLSLHSCCYLL